MCYFSFMLEYQGVSTHYTVAKTQQGSQLKCGVQNLIPKNRAGSA